jgi:hypothetical protein
MHRLSPTYNKNISKVVQGKAWNICQFTLCNRPCLKTDLINKRTQRDSTEKTSEFGLNEVIWHKMKIGIRSSALALHM